MVGRLNWAVQGTRPDMAFQMLELSTKFRKGSVDDLTRSIKAVGKLKDHASKLCFPCLGNSAGWTILMYSDAAFANLNDGTSSTGAHIVLLVGVGGKCCPLSWQANKIKRVVRSTLAAEALSLLEGLEDGIYCRKLLEELLHLKPGTIPISAIVDNRSVVEAVYSTKMIDDKRLRLDISAIKELVESKENTCLKWYPGSMQIANCMTKKGASGLELLTILQNGVIHTS